MTYELVMADECFDDDNGGLIYGINWLDDEDIITDCSWFASEEERQEEIDRWYAEQNQFEGEQ
jgi:hypothetical protein